MKSTEYSFGVILLRQQLPSPLAPLEHPTRSKSSSLIWLCPPLFASSPPQPAREPFSLVVPCLAPCPLPASTVRCRVATPSFPPPQDSETPFLPLAHSLAQCAGEDGTTQTMLYVDPWDGPVLSNPPWLSPLHVVCTMLFHGYSMGGWVVFWFCFLKLAEKRSN